MGNNVGEKFSGIGSFFVSRSSLEKENKDLRSKLNKGRLLTINYDSLQAENADLKRILGREGEDRDLILAAILGRPNQNLYDTLIIDIGTDKGIQEGDIVFASGNVPVGKVAVAYSKSSKVILFSSTEEKTQGIISVDSLVEGEYVEKNVFVEVVGRGGGNFEITLPRDITLSKGDQVGLPGINPYVLGVVETVISDPREPFTKALLVSPVNVLELKFLEVEKS